MSLSLKWWQKGIIYQIYPRSYQDSNGDGIGDLPGIAERLDYVKSLNVDAIWISPIYPSPMHDFGYDVADYTDVDPIFGSMEDFDRLLAEVHERGMKLLLDLVPNHTSDEHPWFVESRSSKDNPKRDWYIWRDPAPDSTPENPIPPNNWLSYFGGPAWTYDEHTGQFYLHLFDTHQPDLNYRNPEVLPAMLDVMRFWLDKGIDGFRVDVIWLMMKDEQFRNEPINRDWDGRNPHHRLKHIHSANLPEVHGIIRKMREVIDEYSAQGAERLFVGEIYLPIEDLVQYYGVDLNECHLPFNFQLITMPHWNARAVRTIVEAYENALPEGAWPNWVLGNHDQHRIATRVGGEMPSRVAHMLLLTLRGTPTCYYGDEIGMEDVFIPPEQARDPQAVNQPEVAPTMGRDPERTPMQWDASPNAGFTAADVEPWLPLAEDYQECNVAVQEEDPTSMLNYFRTLTRLRQSRPSLYGGRYDTVHARERAEEIFSYTRSCEDERFLVVLNFGDDEQTLDFSAVAETGNVALSTYMDREGDVELGALPVRPHEGLILHL